LGNLDAAGAPPNDVRPDAPFDHGFSRLHLAGCFILRDNDAVGDHFFFSDVNLRSFLCRQRRANARHFLILQRALGFATSHAQLVELGD
jgi:hypothetical protein